MPWVMPEGFGCVLVVVRVREAAWSGGPALWSSVRPVNLQCLTFGQKYGASAAAAAPAACTMH